MLSHFFIKRKPIRNRFISQLHFFNRKKEALLVGSRVTVWKPLITTGVIWTGSQTAEGAKLVVD